MISIFRNFARSKWAIGLLGLLALGLLFTGGQQMDVIGALQPRPVISAGDRSLDAQEFRGVIESVRYQQQQSTGQSPTVQQLVDDPQFAGAFRQRAQELGFLAWADRVGIRPGKELILRQIRDVPAFFDPITRKFDQQAYASKLAEARLTPAMLEEQVRDDYVRMHYASAMGAGARLPRIYGAVIANQTQQTRDGRWFTVTQAMAGSAPAPTDAQLQTFMTENAARLRRPELRQASVIVFDNPADASAPISEEKIQERFEFRRDSLGQPERRTFTTLTAPNRETAVRIAAALRAGQEPAAVASANGIQPASYADTPRSAIGDPAIAAAVFGLAANAVSDPIQARVGFVVARVASITPGAEVTLDSARDEIVQELRESEAKAKVFERVEAYDAARRQGRTVDQAVEQVGARFIALPPLTKEGQTPDGQRVNVPPAMLENIYKLTKGSVSEVASLADSQYYAVRLDEVTPATMPTLADIRPALTQAWTARENARLLSSRADALTARLRRGEDIAAVAASVNAPVTTVAGVSQNEQSVERYGQGPLVGLFSTQKGQPFSQPVPTGGIVVGRVDAVAAPTPALAADEAITWRQRMGQSIGQTFLQALVESAARRMKASFDEAQARLALGVEAAPATPVTPAKQ